MESGQTGVAATLCRTAAPPHPTELKQKQPRLLHAKKGWMSKLDEDGTWKKHWFVLTEQSLRYYKDSLAEEASDADGEIDLSTCSDVQEFPVQRNYGFRILCRGGARTLSAPTTGIRRDWIRAIAENARAGVAPDDARSVPEVNPEGRAPPEPRQGVRPEPSPRPEPPDAVGRSKTSDRSRFRIDRTGEPAKGREDAVRRGPSLSATASRRSSPSPSSPVPASAPPTPRVSPTEDDASRPPNVPLPKSPARPSLPERPERVRMPVDRPAAPRDVQAETCGAAASAREEIERRWLRVETTPLREEKRVAIAASSENSRADGLPALLHKELGQKQKALEQLQRQNSAFQEQLEDAPGREQSARRGYVLQSATAPSSSPRRVPPRHSHKLNRDLRSASESPQREQVLARRQIQTLERNPTEARTAADRREADVEAPRSRPASAWAEISAGERAAARARNELEWERDRSKEQEEERGRRAEATSRARRKDGESRLREAGAGLWERSRALRHPERRRALRRDRAREIRRLRGRLREVTARPLATQEGQAPTERRLRKERRRLRESHEGERPSPRPRVAQAEAGLPEAKRQPEAPLGGRRGSAGRERGEPSPEPRREPTPTSDASESPRESVRTLQEEKGLLARRCRQLLERTAEADGEVGELRARLETQRADYRSLENSYERATRESRGMSRSLGEKEEEILRTEAAYRSLLESKEEDLKEALVKMSALGSGLEETERKPRAKEDLLSQTGRRLSDRVEADAARQNLKAEPAAAETDPPGTAAYAEALLCVETGRQLSRASARIRRGQKTSEERSPRRPATQTAELSRQEAVPLFAQTLSFEALVSDEMALLARTSESDLLLQTPTAIRQDVENTQSGDDHPLAAVYADVLTGKLTSETAVRREEPEREAKPRGGVSNEADARAEAAVNASAVFHASVEAELSHSVRNLKLDRREKLRLLEGEPAEARRRLSRREGAPKAIIEASERAASESAIREGEADFGFGPATSAAVCPPELAPYAERIRSQEARRLAEKVVERRLADEMPPGAGDPAEPLQSAGESLAVELRRRAAGLRKYAEEMRGSGSRPELAETLGAALGPRASRPFASAALCRREALVRSRVAYAACRLRAAHKRNSARRRETRRGADVREKCETSLPGERFHVRVEEPEHREESRDATRPAPSEGATDGRQRPKEDPPADADAAKERRRDRVKKLKDDFERQMAQIRRDEAVGSHPAPGRSVARLRLDGSRRRVASSPTEAGERRTVSEGDAAGLLKDGSRQPEAQIDALREQLEKERLESNVAGLRLKYQRDLESLKAACERGFAAMEETHHKVVEDHQREISKLTEERERLLAEETAATVAAVEAMKNAHEEQLEKNRRSRLGGLDADIGRLRLQYREELRAVQRELEVLSERYSRKCLEKAHPARAPEAERQALGRCRRENRELDAHNQESNGRLSAEIARVRSCLSGETAPSPVTPGKDVYEPEVLLRVKESEIQYLKREIRSLKDELRSALRDKKYAADKHKDIYAELSVAKAKADCDIGKLKEKLHVATQASGDGTVWSGDDIMKSKSNPDFTKKEQTTTSEPSASVGPKASLEHVLVSSGEKPSTASGGRCDVRRRDVCRCEADGRISGT